MKPNHGSKSWIPIQDESLESIEISLVQIFVSDLRFEKLRMMKGILLLVILPFCHGSKSWKQVMDSNTE
jgi:hypothetical protein